MLLLKYSLYCVASYRKCTCVDLRARSRMKSSLTLLGCLLLLGQSRAILLCDGDCMGNTGLDICQALPKNKTQLNIMAFFPCNTPDFRARGLTVAAQMAVREIGTSSLLPDYSLKLLVENTMVHGVCIKWTVWLKIMSSAVLHYLHTHTHTHSVISWQRSERSLTS